MSATTNQIGSSWMDRWNDLTARITDGFNRVLLTLFGSSNERFVRRIGYSRANRAGAVHQVTAGSILDRINRFEEFFRGQSDEELRGTTTRLKARLAEGQTLDDILPEAFAAVRESGRRYKGMRHYDVQMVGGVVLHKGNIAEMVTGEGKTLVATLPAYLNGLRGLGVHVITVNDYLARRDCEWMLPIYRGLGMEAAFIQSDMDPLTRKAAYDRDITYGTASEFGFDYLRDNMKRARRGDDRYSPYQQQCMRMLLDEHTGDFRLNFAIIDEVDNILIDEARTPLIISGQAFSDLKRYEQANIVATRLTEEERRERNSQLGSLRAEAEKHRDEYEDPTALTPDGVEGSNLPILPRKKRRPGDPPVSTGILFEVREKEHTVFLTEKGVRRAEELVGVESFFTAGNTEWPHLIDNALKAHHLYRQNRHYAVMNHPESQELSVIIIDEFTGRLMVGRQWSDGLHQAVEAKHMRDGVRIKEETQTLATITLQNFFKLYHKRAGMTGTAMTEAGEFWKIYALEVVAIPTNRPMIRKEFNDVVYRFGREKWAAVVEEVAEVHKTGRPILIGTTDVAKSLELSKLLKKRKVPHELLNALPEHAAREAEIVAQAGRVNAVTISTNMAGRGTDIVLGGNPETMAWAKLKDHYPSRLDVPEDEWKSLVDEIEARERMREEGRRVAELGGLHIVGTERHESRRIDNQLRGRAGRQGDPGSSKFFLALDDDLMRLYNGEWVANVMTRMGMKEGDAIEGTFLSWQIAKAQKRVEQNHFYSRKELLEYDEVMNAQRKQIYGMRQRLLNDDNPRHTIHQMLEFVVREQSVRFLAPDYGPSCFAESAGRKANLEFSARDFARCDLKTAEDIVRRRAAGAVSSHVSDLMEENMPGEDPGEWNYQALAQAANRRWGLNVADGELRRMDKVEISNHLNDLGRAACETITMAEDAPLLDPQFGKDGLLAWVNHSFGTRVSREDIPGDDPNQVSGTLLDRLLALYREKDATFPVRAGLEQFMKQGNKGEGSRYDREGLFGWARHRFPQASDRIREDDFRTLSRDQLGRILEEVAGSCAAPLSPRQVEARIEEVFAGTNLAERDDAVELADWCAKELGLQIDAEGLTDSTEANALRIVLNAYDAIYRPELHAMERVLLLDMIDQHWKQHLYVMDQLRSTIGLRGNSGEDPKAIYKREGMQEFQKMLGVARDRICELAFGMEEVGGMEDSIWVIQQARHDSAAPISANAPGTATNSAEAPKKAPQARKIGPAVGRNDPCTCGSGKKYKNCCMKSVAN